MAIIGKRLNHRTILIRKFRKMKEKYDNLGQFLEDILKGCSLVAIGEGDGHGKHLTFFKRLRKKLGRFDGIFLEQSVTYQFSINSSIVLGRPNE